MKRPALIVVTFVAGGVTLALELLASRVLAPAFGAGLHTWGAILSSTLLCLAAGYRLGGWRGDTSARPATTLVLLVLGAGAWLALLPLALPAAIPPLASVPPPWGPIALVLLLFGAPFVALSTVTPLAFAAGVRSGSAASASTAGLLFALSTVGSVVGALGAAFLLVPRLGVRRSLVALGLVLLASVLPALWRGVGLRAANAALLAAVLGWWTGVADPPLAPGVSFVARASTPYAGIDVVEDERDGSRALIVDGTTQNWVDGAVWERPRLAYATVLLRKLDPAPRPGARALVLGLGAGTIVRGLGRVNYEVDAVEIDDGIVEAARRHFAFPAEGPRVHVADARRFVAGAAKRGETWDAIVVDLSAAGSLPVHAYSAEACRLLKRVLAPGGVVAFNVVTDLRPGHDDLARDVMRTVESVWPDVEAWNATPEVRPAEVANLLVFAAERLDLPRRPGWAPEWRYLPPDGGAPLTDDHAVVESRMEGTSRAWHANVRRWLGDGLLVPW